MAELTPEEKHKIYLEEKESSKYKTIISSCPHHIF